MRMFMLLPLLAFAGHGRRDRQQWASQEASDASLCESEQQLQESVSFDALNPFEALAMLLLAFNLQAGLQVFDRWHGRSPTLSNPSGNHGRPRVRASMDRKEDEVGIILTPELADVPCAFAGCRLCVQFCSSRHVCRASGVHGVSMQDTGSTDDKSSAVADQAVGEGNNTLEDEAIEADNDTVVVKLRPKGEKVSMMIDLGDDGEPKGVNRMLFKPLLEQSEFIMIDVKLPLGVVIEVTYDGAVLVTGAYPGFNGDSKVQVGDLIRGLTGYRAVAGGVPMWQQMFSYTPLGGRIALRRLFFKTEGATYRDVRDAVRSHKTEEGGSGVVTLVLERAVDSDGAMTPREIPTLRPLKEVVLDDLGTERSPGFGTSLDKQPIAERVRQFFDVEDE